jgi:hypothetical protein
MTVHIKLARAAFAVGAASIITLGGVWAYMANIHGQSGILKAAVIVAMPVASIASRVNFFESNIVYWVTIVAGVLLWTAAVYCIGWSVSHPAASSQDDE